MMLPNPGVLDVMIRDRHTTLRGRCLENAAPSRAGIRVRIGHALIAAGNTISGERLEQPARRSSLARTA
jgi:hypothetical protein